VVKVKTLVSGDFGENTYIVERKSGKILIDPGFEQGISLPDKDFKYILLTHGHYDHIRGALLFDPNIIFAHESEKELLEDAAKNMSAYIGGEIVLENIRYFSGERYDMDGIEFFHTPGHTSGCVVIKIEDCCFSGDTLFEDTVGRTDLPTGDSRALQKSLALFDSFDKDTLVYPGHGKPFKLSDAYDINYFLGKKK